MRETYTDRLLMVKSEYRQFQATLRHRIRHFLWDDGSNKSARSDAIRRIMARGWQACLFGGVVRDVAIKSPWTPMRDIDIVVKGVSADELYDAFADVVVRQTRFGGLTLSINGWLFDIWPLETTWAIQQLPLFASSFEVLPKTTFFSVEAIAVELSAKSGIPRAIYESGFVESFLSRTIHLNLPVNPFPELCVVRAFTLAKKLDFALGKDLVDHLAFWCEEIPVNDLIESMRSHYGQQLFDQDELEDLVAQVKYHAQRSTLAPLKLRYHNQLSLPFRGNEFVEELITV